MRKNLIIETITDIRHHIGWLFLTLALTGLLRLFNIDLGWMEGVAVYLVIMVVDSIKHQIKLQ